jgi:nicotinamidase-related amidase
MPLVDRDDSVLAIVDTQPGFFGHDGLSEAERATAAKVVERIGWMTGLAGLIDAPTVAVEEGTDQNGATDERIVGRLLDGVVVHSKEAFSLAASESAMEALAATRRRTAVLIGFDTDACLAQSAVDLLDRGYRVVVVEDATFSAGRGHERGLRRMTQAGAEWNHCKGLALEWLRTVDFGRPIHQHAPRCACSARATSPAAVICSDVSASTNTSRMSRRCGADARRKACAPASVRTISAPRLSVAQSSRRIRPRRSMRPRWCERRLRSQPM